MSKNRWQVPLGSSTEIVGKARRRRFNTSYIDRILKELDEAPHGEGGKILRREGLYSRQVATAVE